MHAKLACEGGELVCAVPALPVERCNGSDDDCDGEIDEDDPRLGELCELGGIGACATGAYVCVDGGLECEDPGPVDEICNGEDDDCNGIVDDEPVCTKIVFATSQAYTGNLGGLEGADTICMYHAELAGLPGAFKAWLSSSTLAAKDRLSHLGQPYVLVDNTVVAYDWADLTDGSIEQMIDLNEAGGPVAHGSAWWAPLVWTATTGLGEFDSGMLPPSSVFSCWDWTTTLGGPAGGYGSANTDSDTPGWTHSGGSDCASMFALYCFEQ